MSGSGGVSIARGIRGENRFYNPPAMRKLQQENQIQRDQDKQSRKDQDKKKTEKQQQQPPQQQQQQPQPQPQPVVQKGSVRSNKKRVGSDECGSSDCSVSSSSRVGNDATNLDRFLEFTTPVVSAQYLPKTSVKGWRTRKQESHPYFVLGDLWESFKEWSAYGAGVPLLMNGGDSVVQYYVPYLSGIQLYANPSKHGSRSRKAGEDSDADSSRGTSSDGSSDYGAERRPNNFVHGSWSQQKAVDANTQGVKGLSLKDKPLIGSSSDESENSNSPGQLIFEYLEHDPPFGREPLADKILVLASYFPDLSTYRSCDLSPSSWVSVAWYPIYRIPIGPTLQNLDACFLTFHSLSASSPSSSSITPNGMSSKLSLPTFGLASYKFKVSVWNPTGLYEAQKVNSLLLAAENWLRRLHVNHPDYKFFVSHSTQWK